MATAEVKKMTTVIILRNKLPQGLPILLKNAMGKMNSWLLPARGTRVIQEDEMCQDIADKVARGYIVLETKTE